MATAWAAMNTFLSMQDVSVSPIVYVRVAKCDDIGGPKLKRDTIDVTTHDNTDDYKEYIGSLKDGQDVTVGLIWDPTDVSHNEAAFSSVGLAFEDGIIRTWKIVYPTSPSMKWTFQGIVVGFEPSSKVKDALRMNLMIKVTGKPILSQGT